MRPPDFTRRVVVTGLGVISPVGNDKDTAWSNLVNGRSGLGEITKFDANRYAHQWAGEVKDFDPARGWIPRPSVAARPRCGTASPRPSRPWPTPGLEITDDNREDVGVVFGSGAGGQALMVDNGEVLTEKGPDRVARRSSPTGSSTRRPG